eukprot:gene1572-12697_t
MFSGFFQKLGIGTKEEKVDGIHYFGFENFGNTCYCNSVLQCLYFCVPLRIKLIDYYEKEHETFEKNPNLLNSLSELFYTLDVLKKKTGSYSPKKFIDQLKKDNVQKEIFKGATQQDAQELLNFLLNTIVELLSTKKEDNFIHELFEGKLTNLTRCMCCETTSSRDESFLDLSIDIKRNTSLTFCLNNFSSIETMKGQDKFYCEECSSLQEAQKSLKIKKLPKVLALHLKRFKFSEKLSAFKKISDRVTFPFELKIDNVIENENIKFELFAIVIHIGSSPNYGHYKALIKTNGNWFDFDDTRVTLVDEKYVQSFFGFPQEDFEGKSETGYILFYQNEKYNQISNYSKNEELNEEDIEFEKIEKNDEKLKE